MRKYLTIPLVAGLLLTGCTTNSDSKPENSTSSTTSTQPPLPKAKITVSKTRSLSTDLDKHPIKITTDGTLESVRFIGKEHSMKLDKVSDNEWLVKGRLLTISPPALEITSSNSEGLETERRVPLNLKEGVNNTNRAQLWPYEGTYGVGIPILVIFDNPVKDKAWVEKNLEVKTTPSTKGSWGWIENDTRAVWKPEKFWKAGTKVSVKANLQGLDLGGGRYAAKNITGNFKIGRDARVKISNKSKQLTFEKSGKTIRTMPVSLGKPGAETDSGTHIIYEKGNPVRMVGEDYDMPVNYAQRYTTRGEYLHSAPWSVGSQGYSNVSHGCVNIGPSNAQWLYNQTLIGDPVIITGTGVQVQTWDGMGAIWNFTDKEWKSMKG